MKQYFIGATAMVGLVAVMSQAVLAQMVVDTDPVVFPAGENSAVIEYRLEGEEVHGFTFEGAAGDPVSITLDAGTTSANFNLLVGGDPQALYNSAMDGWSYSGVLPQDAEYEIRIYLVGQAAKTGGADVTLNVAVGDAAPMASSDMSTEAPAADFADGLAGGPDFWEVHGLSSGDALNVRSGPGTDHRVLGRVRSGDVLRNLGCERPNTTVWCQIEATDGSGLTGWASSAYLRETGMPSQTGDALVEGTNYNAVGAIPCAIEANSSVSTCEFGVTRGRPGLATLFITLPNGFERVIDFSNGEVRPMSAVSSFSVSRSGDETIIDVDRGAEIYTVPDAVVFGG
ncbi:SH3 domain-containing protein [Pelagibacterium sp.]|uniref:SH3 domain-containing protein n=1 Tax=Pelagibacterium sp. TaxID=1967288 RepID=UPI003A90134A